MYLISHTFPIILYDYKRKCTLLHSVRSLAREAQRERRRSRLNFVQSSRHWPLASKNSLNQRQQPTFHPSPSLTLISSLYMPWKTFKIVCLAKGLRSSGGHIKTRDTIRPREDFAFQARVIDRRAGSRGVAGALQQ